MRQAARRAGWTALLGLALAAAANAQQRSVAVVAVGLVPVMPNAAQLSLQVMNAADGVRSVAELTREHQGRVDALREHLGKVLAPQDQFGVPLLSTYGETEPMPETDFRSESSPAELLVRAAVGIVRPEEAGELQTHFNRLQAGGYLVTTLQGFMRDGDLGARLNMILAEQDNVLFDGYQLQGGMIGEPLSVARRQAIQAARELARKRVASELLEPGETILSEDHLTVLHPSDSVDEFTPIGSGPEQAIQALVQVHFTVGPAEGTSGRQSLGELALLAKRVVLKYVLDPPPYFWEGKAGLARRVEARLLKAAYEKDLPRKLVEPALVAVRHLAAVSPNKRILRLELGALSRLMRTAELQDVATGFNDLLSKILSVRYVRAGPFGLGVARTPPL
ncbi:MAG: hypothetical protein KGO96_02440 [Elusimicrobia bacterium]|nr:hypothetical protein [Elusimicrobiota bacterium]MDE2237291.1 hypothetical protein [Elusimicrobiota bacterium]MDE2424753.1 hypothetical protein [Elusimicrobiota bacterium]